MAQFGEANAPDALDGFGEVGASVRRDLRTFADLLATWQRTHNLVSSASLADLWTRHIADSLQLLPLAPVFRNWVDLGSGAGFPGLVLAIAMKGTTEGRFTLVESSRKKAAFLRAAIRLTGAPAVVAAARIETHAATMSGQADVVSARALAPLPELLELAAPYTHADTVLLFPKGEQARKETAQAGEKWHFQFREVPSMTSPEGSIIEIRGLHPKGPA